MAVEKFPLAPMTGIAYRTYGSDDQFLNTGKLEEGSTVDIEHVFSGEDFEAYYEGSIIRVTGFDIECIMDNFLLHAANTNTEVEIVVECLGAGLIHTGPFTYKALQDMLPKRGMRMIHQFDGVTTYLPWITFMDAGWSEYLAWAVANGVKISS
jgi:hypothetical protein